MDNNSSCICFCIICSVAEQTVVPLTRFGKFVKFLRPSSNFRCYNCCFESIGRPLILKQQEITITVEAKTSDDTFMNVTLSVQYLIKEGRDDMYAALYKLDDPIGQLQAYVQDVVRTAVATIDMLALYSSKDEVAEKVKESLEDTMGRFGYRIMDTPVTDVTPSDPTVLNSMNKINAEANKLQAAVTEGEQRKLEIRRAAEADMETLEKQGEGIADQRKAIINGLKESVTAFSKESAVSNKDVLELLLVTQYFDMMKEISAKGQNQLFVGHSPGAVAQIGDEIRNGFLRANAS